MSKLSNFFKKQDYFKISILIILILFLIVFKNLSEIGRYAEFGGEGRLIIDTKTGKIYARPPVSRNFYPY